MTMANGFRHPDPALLEDLRERIRGLERRAPEKAASMPSLSLGAAAIDAALPWGGLPGASFHEIIGDDGAATGFCVALLARLTGNGGSVLWCRRGRDLYAPGLATFGLQPQRLILARGRTDSDILWAMEEGLRSGSLAAVLGETGGIPPIAARRLQLAAETGGTIGLLLCAARGKTAASPAMTRWRVAAAPGPPARDRRRGVATPWWRVDLLRCRHGALGLADGGAGGACNRNGPRPPGPAAGVTGAPRSWLVEWHNETCGFRVAADLRHRPLESASETVGIRPEEERLAV